MTAVRERLLAIVESTDRPTPVADAFATTVGEDHACPRDTVLARLAQLSPQSLNAETGPLFYESLDAVSLMWLNEILGVNPAQLTKAVESCQETEDHDLWPQIIREHLPWAHLRRRLLQRPRPGLAEKLEPPRIQIPTPQPRKHVS